MIDTVVGSVIPRGDSMKLGFFTMPIHPLNKDWRQSLREDREAFLLADKLGYVEGYVGEHATDRAENITSCAVFIASLIDATKTIKLGTGTINMPNAHPASTAAQIAMLDLMLDGRDMLGNARLGCVLALGRAGERALLAHRDHRPDLPKRNFRH